VSDKPEQEVDRKAGWLKYSAFVFSIVALLISAVSFFQGQSDRNAAEIEERPRIGYFVSPYGLEENFGFFIKNTGGKRALIARINFTYNSDLDEPQGRELVQKLNFQSWEIFKLGAGPEMVLEPGEKHYLYVSNKELSADEVWDWDNLTTKLAADICYCSVALDSCWSKRVTASHFSDVSEKFECSAPTVAALISYRREKRHE